jgi:hypothetical protein
VRTWVKTLNPKGEAMESLIVRAGACSPSSAPSRSALQMDSAIGAEDLELQQFNFKL